MSYVKFLFVFVLVSVLFTTVSPVLADGPVARFYSPRQCPTGAMPAKSVTLTGWMVNVNGAYKCEARKSTWLEQRKFDLNGLAKQVKNLPGQAQDYVIKDLNKNINKVTVCNIYQITTGNTAYCTMPK